MKSCITHFSALLLVFVGCRQDVIEPTATVTGMFNGALWQQSGWSFKGRVWKTEGINSRSCQLNTVNVTIEQYNPDGFLRQNLFIAKIPPRVGTHQIRDIYDCDVNADVGALYGLHDADGDVITAVFRVLESANNTLTIERLDSTSRQLSGLLQLTLVATRRSSTTPYDTVRITDCRFTLPFDNR